MGQLSKALEKAEGYKGNRHNEVLPDGGRKLKAQQLSDAGVSASATVI
jgi:hypothetical protein